MGQKKRCRIFGVNPYIHLLFSTNKIKHKTMPCFLQPVAVGGRNQKHTDWQRQKKRDVGWSPSSAFLSHSTNFFICSRKTLFPLARWASLYHFRMASSLKTSAWKKHKHTQSRFSTTSHIHLHYFHFLTLTITKYSH